MNNLSEQELRRIVAETVKETLTALGIPANDPIEVQKDMQHLRAWRDSVSTIKRQSIVTAVGIIVAGICGLIWMAFNKGG